MAGSIPYVVFIGVRGGAADGIIAATLKVERRARSRTRPALGPIWTSSGELPVWAFRRRAPRLDFSKVRKTRRRRTRR